MRRFLGVAFLAFVPLVAAAVLRAAAEPPAWAYAIPPPPPPGAAPAAPAPDDVVKKSLPGSTGAFTVTQIRDAFGPADWYPGDHPSMPDCVPHGRRPDGRA